MEVRSELFCHGCDSYVQFTLDDSLNGNHKVVCPKCGHEHYRVVENGKVTGINFDPSYNYIYYTTNVTCTASSTYDTYQSANAPTGSIFTYNSWMNTGTDSSA